MPTVIDSLVLELGLDASKFTSVQKVAVNNLKQFEAQALRSGQKVEGSAKTMMQAFSRLKVEVLSFTAALLGAQGIKQFIVNTAQANAAIGRFSEVVGINQQELSKWANMATIVGGSGEGMKSTVAGLVRDFAALHTLGQQPEWNFWSKLDLTKFVDAKGDLKDVTGFFLAIADAMKKMSPGDRMLFTEAFHIPTENIPLFNKTVVQLQDMLKEQNRMGVTTKEMSDHAQKMVEAWHEMEQTSQNLANRFVDKMSPILTKMMIFVKESMIPSTRTAESPPIRPGVRSAPKLNLLGGLFNAAGGAAPARPEVPSSKRVWGDKEAEGAGLYEPSGGIPLPRPRPSYANQMAGAGASAGRSSTSTINTSRTINFGGFTINAPNTDPKAIADQIVEQATRRFYAPSSQNGAR